MQEKGEPILGQDKQEAWGLKTTMRPDSIQSLLTSIYFILIQNKVISHFKYQNDHFDYKISMFIFEFLCAQFDL